MRITHYGKQLNDGSGYIVRRLEAESREGIESSTDTPIATVPYRPTVDAEAYAALFAVAPLLKDALLAIIEAGRMNNNSRVQYMVEIARTALTNLEAK